MILGDKFLCFILFLKMKSIEELLNHFQQNLAKYKVPKAFYQVKNLPYTSTGKLQRSKVTYEGNQL